MFLSIIIPAYNEEKRITKTLEKVRDYLIRQDYGWEVLIVNDGSKDNTTEAVSDWIKDKEGFRLINNKENQGKGGVVKQGMLEVKGDWRLFMDADNSTDISELPKLWSFEGYDIIIGSRYLSKGSIKLQQPLLRRMVSRFGNLLIRMLLGLNFADTQCGFKLFSAKAAEEVFPKQTIMRWGLDMEVLTIAVRSGLKIKEVPVDWYDSEGTHVQKSQAFKTLKELWTIKRNLMRGEYN